MDAILKKLKKLFRDMDSAYNSVTRRYGFTCRGCMDNCCDSKFYHHTLAEYYLLKEGIENADLELREKIFRNARKVNELYESNGNEETKGYMCPVNADGLCVLYEWRPMICRLHGVKYSMKRPDGSIAGGNVCIRYMESGGDESAGMDRTRFYNELAGLERDLRKRLGVFGKYKKTTAGMLVQMEKELKADKK